jgi:hypothetical protein
MLQVSTGSYVAAILLLANRFAQAVFYKLPLDNIKMFPSGIGKYRLAAKQQPLQ